MSDPRDVARVIYEARMAEAWGPTWVSRSKWPKDKRAWRDYTLNPIADVHLALVAAKAVLKFLFPDPALPDPPDLHSMKPEDRKDG